MDAKIKKVTAREILDSRGFPTMEADVYEESLPIGFLCITVIRICIRSL